MSVISGFYSTPMLQQPQPIYNTKYLLEISDDEEAGNSFIENGYTFTPVFDKAAYQEAKFQNVNPCAPKRIILSLGGTDIAVFIPKLAGKGAAFKFYINAEDQKMIKTVQEKTLPIIKDFYPSLRDTRYFSLIGGDKEYVIYNKRKYRVYKEQKKYILVKKEKVFLSTIRGKYNYA